MELLMLTRVTLSSAKADGSSAEYFRPIVPRQEQRTDAEKNLNWALAKSKSVAKDSWSGLNSSDKQEIIQALMSFSGSRTQLSSSQQRAIKNWLSKASDQAMYQALANFLQQKGYNSPSVLAKLRAVINPSLW